MIARRFLRLSVAALGFSVGTATLAVGQTAEVEAELRIRLAQLQAQQQAKGQPKAKAAKPLLPSSGMPEGAVARLGDTRLRHSGQPLCVAFSPDGKRLYSGGEDGMLRVWDTATGAAVTAVTSRDNTIRQLRLTHGNTRLAVQLADNRVRFLHPETLKELGEFPSEFGNDFAAGDDGKHVAHVTAEGLLRVTELETNLEKLDVPAGPHFRFHPGGKALAVADAKGKLTLYLLAGGKPVLTIDNGAVISSLAFSPDGKRVACGTIDSARVWDIADHKSPKVLAEVQGAWQVRGWLDNDRIAAGDSISAGVYDLAAKKWVGYAKGVGSVWAVSPDGKKLAAVGATGFRVRLWDLTTGEQLLAENDTFPEAALLAPTADGKGVFVVAGGVAYHWPLADPAARPTGAFPGKVARAAVGKDRLAAAVPDGVLVFDSFDPVKPLAKPARKLTEHAAGCRSLAVSPDGKRVAYSGESARIVIADAATGKTLRVLPAETIGLALAFTPSGERLAVLGRDGFLRLSEVSGDGADLWKVRVQRGQRGTVAFSPDGRLLASSSSGLLKVVNTADGSEAFTIGGLFDNGLFQEVGFSPDGRLLIAASEGTSGGTRAWEIATQSPVRHFTTGFGTAYRLGIFPDGEKLVSAGAEEAITVWDIAGRYGKGAPKAEELLAAWGELDSLDAGKGYPALRTLAAGGADGVRVIAAGIEETAETGKRVEKLVKALGSEVFAEREAATRDLLALGVRALPAVHEAMAKAESPEARTRAAGVATKVIARGVRVPDHGLAGDTLRLFRATQVLEDAGTPEAKSLLAKLAKVSGPTGNAAKAALARSLKR